MNMISCIKQVPYPDTPASAFGVNNEAKAIILPEDVPLVISPFDENAVEAALQIKDQDGGKLTVISLATRPAEAVIRDLKQTLVDAQPVDDAQLRELGSARGEAIRTLLVDESGIDPARVQILDPVAIEASGDRWVRCQLDVAAGG